MSGPAARPAASSQVARKARPGVRLSQFSPRTQHASQRPVSSVSYLTPARLHHISHELTDTDWKLLEFVASNRLASGSHLTRAFWQTSDRNSAAARAARRTLARLRDWRVLEALPQRIGGVRAGSSGMVYAVGVAGAKLLAVRGEHSKRLEAPSALYVAHVLDCTETVVRLHEAHRQQRLDLIEVQPEPACWRAFAGPMGARIILKPDVFLRLAAGPDGEQEDRWFIEVDRATASRGTLQAKLARYLAHFRTGTEQHAHGVYPRVLWSAPEQQRAKRIRKLVHDLPAEAQQLFSVCTFDEAVEFLAAEASS